MTSARCINRSPSETTQAALGNTSPQSANRLFVVSRRYLHKSTIVTTNKRFIDWGEVVPNAACVVSLVDRLMHRAEVIRIEGESYRAKDAEERDAQRRAERATALDTRAGVGCKRMPAGRARGTLACLWASSAKQRRGQQRQTAAEQGRHGIKRHRQCNLVVSSNRPRSSALNADTQQLQTIDEHPHVRPEGVDRRRDRPDPAPQCRRAAQPMQTTTRRRPARSGVSTAAPSGR